MNYRLRTVAVLAALLLLIAAGVAASAPAEANGQPVVENLVIVPARNGLTVTWDHPSTGPGPWEYHVGWNKAGEPDDWSYVQGDSPRVVWALVEDTDYRVWITATDLTSGITGIPVTRTVRTAGAPAATTTKPPATTTRAPAAAPSAPAPAVQKKAPAASTTKAPVCVARRVASKTSAVGARVDTRRLRLRGATSYWTSSGWRPVPAADYRLVLQRRVGTTWKGVTNIAPGPRTTTVNAPRGTYRLVFTGSCARPFAPSVSATFTK